MFQRGKEVHQPGRKLSNQFGDPLAARRTSTGSTGGGGLEKTDSIPEPGSQGQRRRVSLIVFRCLQRNTVISLPIIVSWMYTFCKALQAGLEYLIVMATHQPPFSQPKLRPLTSTSQSSAASQGLFGNLNTQKRGSEDYTERRASYTEMAGNSPGLVSGWFNRTFKGHMDNKPGAAMGNDGKMMGLGSEQQKKEERRGVME